MADLVAYVTGLGSRRKCEDCGGAGDVRWLARTQQGILCELCLGEKFGQIVRMRREDWHEASYGDFVWPFDDRTLYVSSGTRKRCEACGWEGDFCWRAHNLDGVLCETCLKIKAAIHRLEIIHCKGDA